MLVNSSIPAFINQEIKLASAYVSHGLVRSFNPKAIKKEQCLGEKSFRLSLKYFHFSANVVAIFANISKSIYFKTGVFNRGQI